MGTTSTPFDLPEEHREMLPPARRDGLILADIKVKGSWVGILVIDDNHRCIGVYFGRKVINSNLPFAPKEIEAYRVSCAWNRFLAFLPPGLLSPYPVVWLVCPALTAMGHFVSHWLLLTVPVLSVICIYRMYTQGGFPLIRLPTASFGLALSIMALSMFISSLKNYPEKTNTSAVATTTTSFYRCALDVQSADAYTFNVSQLCTRPGL